MTPRRSCILCYHSIDDSGSVISTSAASFRAQMATLAESAVPVVPLTRILETPGAVALTFDDGFENFRELALPILHEFHFSATVFVVTGYWGRNNTWPSQPSRPFIPSLRLMSREEIHQVSDAGITIGSHTVNHHRMSSLSTADINEELRVSKSRLEDITGKAVDTFSYPYGDCGGAAEAVGAHYRLACGTELDFLSPLSSAVDLPRLDAYYFRNPAWFGRLQTKSCSRYVGARRLLRHLRASLMHSPARQRRPLVSKTIL